VKIKISLILINLRKEKNPPVLFMQVRGTFLTFAAVGMFFDKDEFRILKKPRKLNIM